MRRPNCWTKMNFDMAGFLDCMPELKKAVDMAGDIRLLKKQIMQLVDDFRTKYDAIHVIVNLENYKYDPDDNCIDVDIKV